CIIVRNLTRLVKRASPYAPAYAMAVTYMLVVGMFGGIYFVHSTLYVMAFFGVVKALSSFEIRKNQPAI
ncbi:MAG: hypothetical protein JXR26_01520, partial [Balneolaceae bacterium]|nr:hypothetical protein [Balneolaceae bacterium]